MPRYDDAWSHALGPTAACIWKTAARSSRCPADTRGTALTTGRFAGLTSASVYQGEAGMRRWIEPSSTRSGRRSAAVLEDPREIGDAVVARFRVDVRGGQTDIEVTLRGSVLYRFAPDGRIARIDVYNEFRGGRRGADVRHRFDQAPAAEPGRHRRRGQSRTTAPPPATSSTSLPQGAHPRAPSPSCRRRSPATRRRSPRPRPTGRPTAARSPTSSTPPTPTTSRSRTRARVDAGAPQPGDRADSRSTSSRATTPRARPPTRPTSATSSTWRT